MTNSRPTPNRRPRETSPEIEAKIEAFSMEAETLHGSMEAVVAAPTVVARKATTKVVEPEKQPKSRSYTFRMTEETLMKFRSAAESEERSIQWIFDKVLLPHLDK